LCGRSEVRASKRMFRGAEREPQSRFYRTCINDGYYQRVCDCLDTFAQGGDNPHGPFDRLLDKCRKYG
jgi:hypothetical protein